MDFCLKNAKIYCNGKFTMRSITVRSGKIHSESVLPDNCTIIDCSDRYIFPGFADVHVHLREPGFFYKESIFSGTSAAARGGFTAVCAMPNLSPAPDSPEHLKIQNDIIEKTACIKTYPYGTVTVGENGEKLSDMDGLAPLVCAFSDDGHGIQNDEIMRCAMKKAKSLGKIIAAHCEDNSLLNGGYIHNGEYAKTHGHKGICSESEWMPIKRDIELIKETGCAYHVCHVSTKESVELIRRAKRSGLDITCETAPHYLILNDSMLQDDGRFKMNPPIRSEEDRQALLDGLLDGTIDMIATDHAPHSCSEKSGGLKNSLMGVSGLETAFPVLYTMLVATKIISLEKLIELLCINPRKRFSLNEVSVTEGSPADFSVFDLVNEFTINSKEFLSKGKSTPFEGMRVKGKCIMTIYGGSMVWKEN